ncbi:MAG: cupredoxin domain-containing protein [Lysobacteraceae bacterium]
MLRLILPLVFALVSSVAWGNAVPEFTLTIRQHRFIPSELTIPANTKVKLVIVNEDATAEEFESHELNREKIVAGKGRITVYVGPLKSGRYPFFGEFHMATAQGALLVK